MLVELFVEAFEAAVVLSAPSQSRIANGFPLGPSPQLKRSSYPAGSGPPAVWPSSHFLPKVPPTSCILSGLAAACREAARQRARSRIRRAFIPASVYALHRSLRGVGVAETPVFRPGRSVPHPLLSLCAANIFISPLTILFNRCFKL